MAGHHMCACVCCLCIYIYIHVYIHIYIYIRVYINIYTCICMSNSMGNRAFGINSTSNVIEIVRGEAECYFNCFTSAIDP